MDFDGLFIFVCLVEIIVLIRLIHMVGGGLIYVVELLLFSLVG